MTQDLASSEDAEVPMSAITPERSGALDSTTSDEEEMTDVDERVYTCPTPKDCVDEAVATPKAPRFGPAATPTSARVTRSQSTTDDIGVGSFEDVSPSKFSDWSRMKSPNDGPNDSQTTPTHSSHGMLPAPETPTHRGRGKLERYEPATVLGHSGLRGHEAARMRGQSELDLEEGYHMSRGTKRAGESFVDAVDQKRRRGHRGR